MAELGWPDFIMLIKDPRGRRFWVFSDQIFFNDFITEFFKQKNVTQKPFGRKIFPGQVSKSFERQVNDLYKS